jgi:hypothetical protein
VLNKGSVWRPEMRFAHLSCPLLEEQVKSLAGLGLSHPINESLGLIRVNDECLGAVECADSIFPCHATALHDGAVIGTQWQNKVIEAKAVSIERLSRIVELVNEVHVILKENEWLVWR